MDFGPFRKTDRDERPFHRTRCGGERPRRYSTGSFRQLRKLPERLAAAPRLIRRIDRRIVIIRTQSGYEFFGSDERRGSQAGRAASSELTTSS